MAIGSSFNPTDLVIKRGDTTRIKFTMPWELGDTYRMQIRCGYDGSIIKEFSYELIDEDAKRFDMVLDADDTAEITENVSVNATQEKSLIGVWDLQRETEDGVITTIAGGKAYLKRDVTRND
jgi:hypothetical protein